MTSLRRTHGIRGGMSAALTVALVAGTASPVALAQSGVSGAGAAPPPGATSSAVQPTTPMPTAPSSDYPENVEPYEYEAIPAGDAGNGLPETATKGGVSVNNAQGAGAPEGVRVSEYLTVDLFVQDEDLANVLQMLSLQTQRNIVASRDVNARVTANLYGVTFYEALDAILSVNGYGFLEKGPFIYVHTLEELAKIQQAERQIVSKVLQLNYLNANDAAEFVAPLLSERGTIKTNGDVGRFQIPTDTPTGDEEFALAATLVVYDYPEHVAEIEALLDQIDTRPAQVLVEATILQTQLNEANAFGVDFAFLNGVNFTDFFGFGGPLGVASSLNSGDVAPADNRGTGIVSSPGNSDGPATLKLSILHDDIALFIRALDEVSDVTILSNPKILALNRQPARVLVGRKVGYLNTTSTETATTQTVEFLDTGTQLAFRPFISKDGMIRMELKPRVSEGVIREASDATGAAVTIPDEITQELTTNVIVPDGSTVVLGGLFKETTNLTRRQVPILGDIPIVGTAFRGHDDETDRQEIIFMIKPTIMSDQIMIEQGDRAMAYQENLRTGTRSGLLPWSREKQTAQLNMKAERLMAEGKTDEARWALRRSLELSPVQPDAIRQQESLMGDSKAWPHRSILESVINGEARQRTSMLKPGASPAGSAASSMNAASMSGAIDSDNAETTVTADGTIEVEVPTGPASSAGQFQRPDSTSFGQSVTEASEGFDSFDAEPMLSEPTDPFLEPFRFDSEEGSGADEGSFGPQSNATQGGAQSEWIVTPEMERQLQQADAGQAGAFDRPAQTAKVGQTGATVRRDAMMKSVASGGQPSQANAGNTDNASQRGAMSGAFADPDFLATVSDPWSFTQSVPNMPFGMFWTAVTWMQLESAYLKQQDMRQSTPETGLTNVDDDFDFIVGPDRP